MPESFGLILKSVFYLKRVMTRKVIMLGWYVNVICYLIDVVPVKFMPV